MFRTFASRTLAAAAALAVTAVPAVSAAASPTPDPVPIGHNQFFAGLVFGTAEQSQIEVACAGPATTGHPMTGQSVEAILVAPPAPPSAGFTGSRASTIRVVLSWIVKGKTVTKPIGTLTGYYENAAGHHRHCRTLRWHRHDDVHAVAGQQAGEAGQGLGNVPEPRSLTSVRMLPTRDNDSAQEPDGKMRPVAYDHIFRTGLTALN